MTPLNAICVAPKHTSHFFNSVAVELLKRAPGEHMVKILWHSHTRARFRAPAHIYWLFLSAGCHRDSLVIKAYQWALSAAPGGLRGNDSLLAWHLADMDTVWTTRSPFKPADLTETPTSSWCLRRIKEARKWPRGAPNSDSAKYFAPAFLNIMSELFSILVNAKSCTIGHYLPNDAVDNEEL